MTIHSRKELKWVKSSLWYKDTYILAIVEDLEQKGMFWIKWPDGTQSDDYYNKTRARNHAMALTLKDMNNGVEEDE